MVPQGLFPFLSVGALALFSFVAVAVWSDSRRKEREAYYRSESIRRIAEMPGEGAKQVLELVREEDRLKRRRSTEGMKVGGLVNIGIGLGLAILLESLAGTGRGSPYLVGLLPALIGVALLVYVYLLAPRKE